MVVFNLYCKLCGIGLNFGVSIGIVCGLLGGLISIELDLRGFTALFVAIATAIPIAAVVGYLYALLLNRTKGSEMTVSTYAGFSVISLFCIIWLLAPFRSLEIKWPIGTGLRTTITLQDRYAQVLDNFMKLQIGSLRIPTGLLLFVVAACILVAIFLRSKKGVAMAAAG